MNCTNNDIENELQLHCLNKVGDIHEPLVNVKGRLKAHISFWEHIGASSWVLSIIRHGYALPFVEEPSSAEFSNHQSALRNQAFVTGELDRLLKCGCIKEVPKKEAFVISPLGVDCQPTKNRLILDLRFVNQMLQTYHFKYEDLRTLRDIFQTGDWFFRFDYKSGYHHVDIIPQHQQYLAFAWGNGCLKKYFVFTVLPFGLSTAPFVFTKIQKALVKHWRAQGIKIFTYLDDGVGGGANYDSTKSISNTVKRDVEQSGFLWHPEKSVWEPSQHGEVLGFLVDLERGIFQVPEHRIQKLQRLLGLILKSSQATAREMARVTGMVVSMGLALGPVARLWTRAMYRTIMEAPAWCTYVSLDEDVMREIVFWKHNFDSCHGQPIWLANPKPMLLTYSDASSTGWGGYSVTLGEKVAKGSWLPEEEHKSSTWRELRATRLVLDSLLDDIRGKVVRHRTDNQNVETILSVGSRNKDLHDEAVALYQLCHQFGVCLQIEWIPREFNEEADRISRQTDIDDYMLNPTYFAALDLLWGPHTVDRFSSFRTRQVPRFCSRYLNPSSEHVDAFTADWSGEVNWLFPPPYLIPRVIQHMMGGGEDGTLVAPLWTSAPWWPILSSDGHHPEPWIREWMDLPLKEDMFIPAVPGTCCFGSESPSYRVLALKLCFSQPWPTHGNAPPFT